MEEGLQLIHSTMEEVRGESQETNEKLEDIKILLEKILAKLEES